jgi:ABC-2 type transport system ATP-binding protein
LVDSPSAKDAVNAIEIDGITKDFTPRLLGAKVRALDGVTLRVGVGEVMGLLGPNGSGKSTLLKIAVGLLAPTAGACRIEGVPSGRVEARRGVGYLPEAPDFCPHLTGFELVLFHARLGRIPRAGMKECVEAVIARVGLVEVMHRRIGTYSQGMRQRIGLAQALVTDPRVLILDEPTAGIDPVGAAEIGALINRFKTQGRTVLFSSHLPGQIEDLCDRVALIDHGRLVLQERVDELTRRRGQTALLVDPLPEGVLAELRTWLQARGVEFHGEEMPRSRLERIFVETVGRGGKEGDERS